MIPRGLSRAFGHLGNERGARTEERVVNLIRSALRRRALPDWIRSVRLANSHEDRLAADVVVGTPDGAMFLQVKASQRGAESASADRARDRGVPIVVASKEKTDAEVLETVLSALTAQRQRLEAARAATGSQPLPAEAKIAPPREDPAPVAPPAPSREPALPEPLAGVSSDVSPPIPYCTDRSGFLHQARSLLSKRSLEAAVTFVLDASKAGYRGSIVVQLAENDGHFSSDFVGDDVTRFPARIRAVATALHRLGHRGWFRISHDDGTITIEPLPGPAASPNGCEGP